MEYSVSASVFLAIIIVIRLNRRTESRRRTEEQFTVLTSVVFGILIAATPWGQAVLHLVDTATEATH
ncbi:hypothetical protein AB0442_41340 [Kitasatospora sp. NPDC085895]|uniref:hypothetical protein n=1 Tax=Kitasatospora sp. NPDC085895 TaxID=3155057 RepID=UPI00344DA2E6